VTDSTTFGLIIPQRGALFGLGELPELLSFGVQAERAGVFDTLWIGDSLTSKHRPEAIACVGALAGMTSSIRLAVGCMASFALRDPALLALQWATLDRISGGRMLLSVCNGLQGKASALEGEHFGGVRDVDRAARLEEHMALLRSLWTGDVIDFEGRFHTYHGLQVLPTPVQDPCPIWVTANPAPGRYFERVMRRVGTVGDGWMTNYPGPDGFRELLGAVRSALADAGRADDDFPVALYHNINIGPRRGDCKADARRFADEYYGPAFPDSALDAMTVSGPVAECVDQLVALAAQGATHIALRMMSFDQHGQFPVLVNEVLPEVQARLAASAG
jgi:alkanesulfonate monooxygenase SsuD/methylene tetrahydromethanopterin reductase-like flavin-dependent oxidoreductase (luciferase family)